MWGSERILGTLKYLILDLSSRFKFTFAIKHANAYKIPIKEFTSDALFASLNGFFNHEFKKLYVYNL